MRNIFLAGTALAILGVAPAFAADLASRPYTKAPVFAPASSWTGFYLGGHVGAGWNTNGWSNQSFPQFEEFNLPFGSGTANGMLGGFQGGFNYQIAPKLVIGIEGEYSFADIKGDTNSTFDTAYSASVKQRNIAAVTGKIGTVYHDDILIYAKGGWAWSQFNYDAAVNFGEGPASIGRHPTVTDNRSGFTFGVGTEYKIDRNWSAKVEYDYYDFGKKNVAFPTGTFGEEGTPAFNADIAQNTHVIKIGANYNFGWMH
jgi:outer membrane immunogenic protein